MSETASAREPSVEARWLRANWDANSLGSYEGKWIAVKGEGVEASDQSIANLIERTRSFDPLYAFVMLGPRQ